MENATNSRRMSPVRLPFLVLVALIATLLTAAGASAKTVELHNYAGVYPAGSWEAADAVGAPAFGAGSLEKIDVDKQTGTVYVASSTGRIYKFSASGASQPFSSVAPNTVISQSFNNFGDLEVDNSGTASQGQIYAFAEYGPIKAYDPTGAALTGTGFPIISGPDVCGAAVSSDGHLWAHIWQQPAVEYDATGAATGVQRNLQPAGYCDFDMDALGNFYAPTSYSGGAINKYAAGTGTFLYQLDPGTSVSVAVDYSNNDVYVNVGNQIRHYTSTGSLIESFASPSGGYPGIAGSRGIAVNSQTHTVYVTSNGSPTRVDTFPSTGPVIVPDATTEDATAITRTNATLNGIINPDGVATTECKFEYGLSPSPYSSSIPCAEGNVFTGSSSSAVTAAIGGLAAGTLYHYRVVAKNANGTTTGSDDTFTTVSSVKDTLTKPATNVTRTSATLNGSFDADGFATNYWFEYGQFSCPCADKVPLPAPPGENVGTPVGTYEASKNIAGLTLGTLYHYRIVAENSLGKTEGADQTFTTITAVKDTVTEAATNITINSATINGSFDPDGISTAYYFEYGKNSLGLKTPAFPPGGDGGATVGKKTVSENLTNLEIGKTYLFRLVAINGIGTTKGTTQSFVASQAPTIANDTARFINTDGAVLSTEVNPNALATQYHFEYGPEPCSISVCTMNPDSEVTGITFQSASLPWTGLSPGQDYYFRVIATNARGTTTGPDRKVRTYLPDPGVDTCPNTEVRLQTGAALLLDCRAYELASTTNSGGYDVESDLIPGQAPLAGYPWAGDRLLYSVHAGVIPGATGNPTNFGRDPYVATRGSDGWSTEYVGLSSDGMADEGSYGSPLLGADQGLSVFAFGGKDICSPCFSGPSTNVPLRLEDHSLVKGMAGSLNPNADPAGLVAAPFSDDGNHFIFGADKKFETAGKEGSVSIYDRNLESSTTQVVSTLPNGETLSGDVGQLDISKEGSRIVVGQKVSTDGAGNSYWRLYLHIGSSPNSVELAPGATTGVIFAGMTSDGTKVFFTSKDKLVGSDTDESADLYQATVGPGGGPAVLTRLSSGTPAPSGDSDACNPTANVDGNNWNAVGGASTNSCGVVAVAGGGGVAEGDGTIYFFSPEELDGEGAANEPNLFVVVPGSAPRFVNTLEPSNMAVRHAVADSEVFRYGDFQVTRNGDFAVFNSSLPLTGFNNVGHIEIYRYSTTADATACASCAPSFASPLTDTSLPPYGLSVADDGRVFFTTVEALVLRDTNGKKDAYEWKEGTVQLISRGTGSEDSGMLSVSADGKNAFFFTRETLVHEDVNGSTIKIYDAREGGGFLFDPPSFPCAASDECHGAGTKAPPPAVIPTVKGSGRTVEPGSTAKRCRKGKVRRHGKCVKRHPKKKRHSTQRHG